MNTSPVTIPEEQSPGVAGPAPLRAAALEALLAAGLLAARVRVQLPDGPYDRDKCCNLPKVVPDDLVRVERALEGLREALA